jgi:hypothetical protein
MLQMTLHLTWSSRLRTFQLLGFEVFQVRLQKSHFNRFYINFIYEYENVLFINIFCNNVFHLSLWKNLVQSVHRQI